MEWLSRCRDTVWSLWRRKQVEQDLEDELRYHVEQETENNIRAGMTPDEAKFAAFRLVGPMAIYKEECRDARRSGVVEDAIRDLRYALRMLKRTPLFTAVAMVTLAIGIGANTTVFTFVENFLLRQLPVDHPEQLDSLSWGGVTNISYPNYTDFRDRNRVFSDLVAYRFLAANMSTQPRDNFRLWGYEATGNYFATLGVQPILGRFFGPEEDDKTGAHPVVVISYRCWQSRFDGDPRIIGRVLKINGYPFTIIGVAGPSFSGTELIVSADYWVPMSMELQVEPGNEWVKWRASQNAWVLGRRKPQVSRPEAQANLEQIAAQLATEYPNDVPRKTEFHLAQPGLIGEDLRRPLTGFAGVLIGVAGLGLLLACMNLAGMLLARASDRRREVAIRLAIGAGRVHLLRQLMIESLVLAIAGGMLGYVLAAAACHVLSVWHPSFDIPVETAIHPDSLVLYFTVSVIFVTTVLFGLVPALQTIRIDLIPSLKNEPLSHRFRRWSVRDVLVSGQIALSVLLVICSVLMVRSLQHALTQG